MISLRQHHADLIAKLAVDPPPTIKGTADHADAEALREWMERFTRAHDFMLDNVLLNFANRKAPIYSDAKMKAFRATWNERAEARRHSIALDINELDPLDAWRCKDVDLDFDIERERSYGKGA